MKWNDVSQAFSRNCVIALLSTTLVLAPALAIAATIDMPKSSSQVEQVEQVEDEWSSQDYVNSLKGLTDAERAELKALYDKTDAYWEAGGSGVDLTDADWNRMSELEEKARHAEIKDALTPEERDEIEALWNKLDALEGDEDLTDAEWNRLIELEDRAYGYDDWDEGGNDTWDDDWDLGGYAEGQQSNEDYVNLLKGLTDAERTELIALYDKLDTYWDSWGFTDESCGLTDAEWDRMAEIEDKAFYAELAENLTDAEFSELKGLYDKLDALAEDEDLTDEQWNRLLELVDKGYGNEVSYDA